MIRFLLLICICFSLSSCGWLTKTEYLDIGKPVLEISKPEPLKLYTVNWDVRVIEDKPYFILDSNNFENLAKNTEMLQNRLFLQNKIIDSQTQYYKK